MARGMLARSGSALCARPDAVRATVAPCGKGDRAGQERTRCQHVKTADQLSYRILQWRPTARRWRRDRLPSDAAPMPFHREPDRRGGMVPRAPRGRRVIPAAYFWGQLRTCVLLKRKMEI